MHARHSPPIQRRRFAWLVWLGLLLPVAQVAAAGHALSHTRPESPREGEGKQAPNQAHCETCLVAAAIGGGAPLGKPQTLTSPALRHQVPHAVFADVWLALPVPAYRSRAPPDASR